MDRIAHAGRILGVATVAAAALGLAACGDNERTAEAETPVSEAEVSTELPEGVVSDTQLEAAANAAAEVAAMPPPDVVPVPVPPPAGNGAAGAGAAGTGAAGTGAAGTGTTNAPPAGTATQNNSQ